MVADPPKDDMALATDISQSEAATWQLVKLCLTSKLKGEAKKKIILKCHFYKKNPKNARSKVLNQKMLFEF